MTNEEFVFLLEKTRCLLDHEARTSGFVNSPNFENRVREVLSSNLIAAKIDTNIDFNSHAQAFPDICLGEFGIEVKFTEKNTWSGVANSISQGMKNSQVKFVHVIWCKMGGIPEVRCRLYEDVVYHVRTSHVPRFEVDMEAQSSLFNLFKLSYTEFSTLSMEQKMDYVRSYARNRLKNGVKQYYWYLDSQKVDSNLKSNISFFSSLAEPKKRRFLAEELLLFPQLVDSRKSSLFFDDRVRYFLNKHLFLYPQSRSLLEAIHGPSITSDKILEIIDDLSTEISDVLDTIDINRFRQFWTWSNDEINTKLDIFSTWNTTILSLVLDD